MGLVSDSNTVHVAVVVVFSSALDCVVGGDCTFVDSILGILFTNLSEFYDISKK